MEKQKIQKLQYLIIEETCKSFVENYLTTKPQNKVLEFCSICIIPIEKFAYAEIILPKQSEGDFKIKVTTISEKTINVCLKKELVALECLKELEQHHPEVILLNNNFLIKKELVEYVFIKDALIENKFIVVTKIFNDKKFNSEDYDNLTDAQNELKCLCKKLND